MNTAAQSNILPAIDDGLEVTAAEPWIKGKVELMKHYASSFLTVTAEKADDVILVDLYSGNGLYSLGARKEVFPSVSYAVLSAGMPYSKYVLCEKDRQQSHVLKVRLNRKFRGKNIVQLEGKPSELLEKFKVYVPQGKSGSKTAVLAVCDPFSLELDFETMTHLIDLGFSLVVPVTFALNDRLNYRFYLKEGRDRLNNFLGITSGVEKLEAIESNEQFYKKVVQLYEHNMRSLGISVSFITQKVDSGLMDIPFYSVGFFSGRFSAKVMEQEVKSRMHVQFDLFG